MPSLRTSLQSLALVLLLASAPVRATDYTDIWYVPTESGWGANVVQSDLFLFVTFFVYGPDGKLKAEADPAFTLVMGWIN